MRHVLKITVEFLIIPAPCTESHGVLYLRHVLKIGRPRVAVGLIHNPHEQVEVIQEILAAHNVGMGEESFRGIQQAGRHVREQDFEVGVLSAPVKYGNANK